MSFFDDCLISWNRVYRSIVDSSHGTGRRRERPFAGAPTVSISDFNTDIGSHINIGQRVCVCGGSADRNSVSPPLIAECSQSIVVADGGHIGADGLIFFHCTNDHRQSDRHVVDVQDSGGLRTCQRSFDGSVPVGVTDFDTDIGVHVGIAQRVSAGARSADCDSVSQPLIVECSYAVIVADTGGVNSQILIFRRGADNNW